jgi:hypothetical protein
VPSNDGQQIERTYHLDCRAARLASQGAAAGDDDDLLSTAEVADWFGCSMLSLGVMRREGGGPPFVYILPGIARYRREAVVAWLRERETSRLERAPGHGRRGRPRGSKVINGKLILPGAVADNRADLPDRGELPQPIRARVVLRRPQR